VAVSSNETFFSTVNYRGFPWQLTAAGLGNPRQLTAEGQFRILHVFLNLIICVNNNFRECMCKYNNLLSILFWLWSSLITNLIINFGTIKRFIYFYFTFYKVCQWQIILFETYQTLNIKNPSSSTSRWVRDELPDAKIKASKQATCCFDEIDSLIVCNYFLSQLVSTLFLWYRLWVLSGDKYQTVLL